MSLPDEFVRAQERIIQGFIDDKFDRKEWPKHLINGTELKMLFDENDNLREENRKLCDVIDKITSAVIEYEREINDEVNKGNYYD